MIELTSGHSHAEFRAPLSAVKAMLCDVIEASGCVRPDPKQIAVLAEPQPGETYWVAYHCTYWGAARKRAFVSFWICASFDVDAPDGQKFAWEIAHGPDVPATSTRFCRTKYPDVDSLLRGRGFEIVRLETGRERKSRVLQEGH